MGGGAKESGREWERGKDLLRTKANPGAGEGSRSDNRAARRALDRIAVRVGRLPVFCLVLGFLLGMSFALWLLS